MDTRLKPVPAFYCCYLLRSTVRHSSLYIGSSPNPARRLAQHNGKAQGGAVRTSRLSLRPWEMVCIVAGFPSNIAALQFEWAWHNAHLTKHIAPEERLSMPTTRARTNARTGKMRKKVGRPRTSLMDKLSNLHLLLRSSYFSKWPLELRFFNDDVHSSWLAWNERLDERVRPEIKIMLDKPHTGEVEEEISSAQRPVKCRKADLIGKGGVEGIDPTYARFQPVLMKLRDLIDSSGLIHACDICSNPVDMRRNLYNICLHQNCRSITHLTCLSTRFLSEQRTNELIPREGLCPACHSSMIWSDLMRVLTLRMRSDREITKLLKKRNPAAAAAVAAELLDDESGSEDTQDEEGLSWDVESDMSDAHSVASMRSSASTAEINSRDERGQQSADRLEIVIEDSEDDNL